MNDDDSIYPCGYCPLAKIKSTGPFGEEYYECDIPENEKPEDYDGFARCLEYRD